MEKIKKNACAVLLLLAVFICMMALDRLDVSKTHMNEHITLYDGWIVETGSDIYENADLRKLQFSQTGRGDEITYSTTLPAADIGNPVLLLYTVHSAVEVFVDGESIYRYGWERIEPKRLMGYGFHFVELPKNFAGKKIVIHEFVAIHNAFTNLNTPIIGDANYIVRDICMERKYALAINLFLIIFGISLLFVSALFARKYKDFFKLMCVGAFSVGVALWSICSSNLIILFTYNPLVKAYLEFAMLYFAGIPLLLYYWGDIQRKKSVVLRLIYDVIVIAQVTFSVGVTMLQLTNIVLFPELLTIEHVLLCIVGAYLLTVSIYDIRTKQFSHMAVTIGMLCLLVVGIASIVTFNIEKYVVSFQGEYVDNALCIGALFFVFGQIVDFCMEISSRFYETARAETLERMAYTDALTGVFNRRKIDEEFDSLQRVQTVYGIYAFDLNNLKVINDSLGHEKGDLLLIGFAKILKEAFQDVGVVCRIGGDEFSVIISDVTSVNITELNHSFLQKLEENKVVEEGLEISVAYGYCQRDEYGDVDVKAIYHKADVRMYEMKMKMKYMS